MTQAMTSPSPFVFLVGGPRSGTTPRDHADRLRELFTGDLLARKQVLPANW